MRQSPEGENALWQALSDKQQENVKGGGGVAVASESQLGRGSRPSQGR